MFPPIEAIVQERQSPYGFLKNGGRIGRRIGKLDWSHHPLGPITGWDPALCTSLGVVLGSPLPTFLIWGEHLTLFFNDAYEPMLGYKAHSLGSPFPAVWHEVWDALGPWVRRVMEGESFLHANYPATLERYGYAEQARFTFSYSPLHDAQGAVRGILCSCIDLDADAGLVPAPPGTSEERIRQSSETIRRQARHMTALVDALLGDSQLTPAADAGRADEQ